MRRVHGLKSGKMLKEFVGHTSYVNDAVYSPDGSQIISAASDSTVRVWDAKSCEELRAFKCAATAQPLSLHRILRVPLDLGRHTCRRATKGNAQHGCPRPRHCICALEAFSVR